MKEATAGRRRSPSTKPPPIKCRVVDAGNVGGGERRRLAVVQGTVIRLVPPDDIVCITIGGGRVCLHLAEGDVTADVPLGWLTDALGAGFMRVNRRTTVNLSAVSEIRRRSRYGEAVIVVRGGNELPVTRLYAPLLRAWLTGSNGRTMSPRTIGDPS